MSEIATRYPITLLYGSLLGLLLVALSLHVLRYRVRSKTLGPGAAERMNRVQGNFVEYVPLALILLALLEDAGAPRLALHVIGGLLVVARLAHAYGLGYHEGRNYPRMLGALATFLLIGALSMAGLAGALHALR